MNSFVLMAPGSAGAPLRLPLTRVVLVGGTADDRLLLRGLLRLHRHRVAAEIEATGQIDEITPSGEQRVLLLLADPADPDWPKVFSAALARDPNLVGAVLTAHRSPAFDRCAADAGAHAVLVRPFRVKDLVDTVEGVARGENRLAGTAGA